MPDEKSVTRSVDYDTLNEFKRESLAEAATTSGNAERFGMKFVEWSRGESVQLFENPEYFEGRVLECLGTKYLVAAMVQELLRLPAPRDKITRSYLDKIAQCAFAMIVNDMVTLAIFPTDIRMYLAVGSSLWFKDRHHYRALIHGWKAACQKIGCVWTGGETAELSDIIMPDAIDLAGSASGRSIGKRIFNPASIRHGDAIVFAESSGIHANGLTDARGIAEKLPDGYLTEVVPGQSYGEMLLQPTHLYPKLVEACIREEIDVHYAVNVTGHGLRKLMRAERDFSYIVETLPFENPLFGFIQRHGKFDDRSMFSTFNMGAGFALFMPEDELPRFFRMAERYNFSYDLFKAGHIEAGEKRVVIEPKGIEFKADTLQLR